jgi:hypothetical protein
MLERDAATGNTVYTDQNTWGLAKNVDVVKEWMTKDESERKTTQEVNARLSAQSQDIREILPYQYDGTKKVEDLKEGDYGVSPTNATAEETRRADATMNWVATLARFFEQRENYGARKKAGELLGLEEDFAPWEIPDAFFNILSRYLTQRTKNPEHWRESITNSNDELLKKFISDPAFNKLFSMID